VTKKDARHLGMSRKALYLVTVFSSIMVLLLLACSKEKAMAPKVVGPVGTCETLEKLPKDVAKPFEISYGNKIKLIGITTKKISPNQLGVSYYWQPMNDLTPYNVVFVHFVGADGKILFQNDHSFCPQKAFEELKGKVVKETFKVSFPKNADGQEISVRLGLYDPKVAGRLKISSSSGIPTDEGNTRAIVESLKL
jgi:hypothetical protein